MYNYRYIESKYRIRGGGDKEEEEEKKEEGEEGEENERNSKASRKSESKPITPAERKVVTTEEKKAEKKPISKLILYHEINKVKGGVVFISLLVRLFLIMSVQSFLSSIQGVSKINGSLVMISGFLSSILNVVAAFINMVSTYTTLTRQAAEENKGSGDDEDVQDGGSKGKVKTGMIIKIVGTVINVAFYVTVISVVLSAKKTATLSPCQSSQLKTIFTYMFIDLVTSMAPYFMDINPYVTKSK